MSGRENSDNVETLFSFELLVDYIRIEKVITVSDELALGVRLLDFPTLLIYQPPQSIKQREHHGKGQRGEYAFNRGKSCLFKMHLNSAHFSNTPLYAMVLDVNEEMPKLVGTSLISLAKVMDRIRRDVREHGLSTPSSHGERGFVGICNLTGERIGSISLSYKLLRLGASSLPHITERRALKSTRVHGGQPVRESIMEKNMSAELLPLDWGNFNSPTLDKADVSRNLQNSNPSTENTLITAVQRDGGICVATQTRSQMPQTLAETEGRRSEEDLTVFCPPHLFYSNSEDKSKNEGGDCKLLNLDSEAFAYETAENATEATGSPLMDKRVRHDVKASGNQETSGVTPNVLGEALRQLPLLNALLVELSQLNDQNPAQPLSVHPSLAWIYRPVSTEPSAGHGNTARKAQTKVLQKTRLGTGPHLKKIHSSRNCSTPVERPASVNARDKQAEALIESKRSGTSPRKKLVYGTTKTFNLRLKQVSPLKVNRRECMELIQGETQSSKGRTKSSIKITKSSKKKSELNPSSSLNGNIETVIQSITVNSALQETVTLKQKNLPGKVQGKQDGDSEKPSLPERDLKCIHIPSVERDNDAENKDTSEHPSLSNQSQSESARRRGKIESSGSSRHSSPTSSFADSGGEGNEEADYADDFNSLEPSDAHSPDPVSSPEPCRAKTPSSPARPDFCNSDSASFQKRAALPVPVKAPSSPQHALRGTHIIRPRTHASALSFSSDDGDGDRSASLRTLCSRKQATESSRVERSSGGESFVSSRGQRGESAENVLVGLSAELISPQDAEELEDELGSLDFRKEYQHISKLVANKLPGYTM